MTSYKAMSRRFKKSKKHLPKTQCATVLLRAASEFSNWSEIADVIASFGVRVSARYTKHELSTIQCLMVRLPLYL